MIYEAGCKLNKTAIPGLWMEALCYRGVKRGPARNERLLTCTSSKLVNSDPFLEPIHVRRTSVSKLEVATTVLSRLESI